MSLATPALTQPTLWEASKEDNPQCCEQPMLRISYHPDDVTHRCLTCGTRYQKGLYVPFHSYIPGHSWDETDRVWLLHLASLMEGWHR
jgi:hypothetical protein